MKDPVAVEVEKAVEKLEEDAFDHWCGNGMAGWLSVMVYDLEEIMFAIFEDHEDAFVFEDNLHEVDKIRVRQFRAKRYLTDG